MIEPLFKNFHIEILEIVEDAKAHKVAFHARSTAETPIGPYANEYMIMMQMTADDQRVTNVKEFVDSGYTTDFFANLRANAAKTQS